MNPDQKVRLLHILGNLGQPTVPTAIDKQGEAADVICRECKQFYTWKAVELDVADSNFICSSCRSAAKKRTPLDITIAVLKMPATYVVLLTLASLIAYLAGAGRVDIEAMQALDADRKWHQRQAPRLYLGWAARTKLRVTLLEARDDPPTELIEAWAGRSREAFVMAADAWQGQLPEADMRLAAAVMRAKAGEPRLAYQEIHQLENQFLDAKKKKRRLSYLYWRGLVALMANNTVAAKEDLERLLNDTLNVRREIIDFEAISELVYAGEGGATEQLMTKRVREVCGTSLPEIYLVRESVEALEAYGVESMLANTISRELKAAGAWNREEEEVFVETFD